ncbi:MAG: creatininase family protein [Sphaerochaetaceae bacterium]
MKTVKLEELNEKSFIEGKYEKAIFVLGATESHGSHLPFGTDVFTPYDIALDVAKALDHTFVVPPLWYGMSLHYQHKPMCITLSLETLGQVAYEVLHSLYHWNIRKVLIINGHDGNIPCIEYAIRNMKTKFPDMNMAWLGAWWSKIKPLIPEGTLGVWDGLGHGGEGETSITMATVPHLCDLSEAKGMLPDYDPVVDLVWNFQDITDYGASGVPSLATEEKGKIMKKALTDYLIDFVQRMDKQGWRYESS